MPGALWLWLSLSFWLWLWLAVSLTHSQAHTRTWTPPIALGARPPALRPPSPRALCPCPASSEPALPEPRRCAKPGAAEPESPSVRVLRAAVLGGRRGGPEMGLQLCPGVGTGGDWPAPRVLSSPSPAPRCRHPPPRRALTGFPAWEGSARKSEASGDRGHLLLGHKCPKRRWGWEDVPVSETPLSDFSTRRRACPWTAGQHPCCSSRQRSKGLEPSTVEVNEPHTNTQ